MALPVDWSSMIRTVFLTAGTTRTWGMGTLTTSEVVDATAEAMADAFVSSRSA